MIFLKCRKKGWHRPDLRVLNVKINPLLGAMNNEMNGPDGTLLLELVRMKMPFGKYKGIVLASLPVSYLEWFAKEGFPPGKLGM